MRGLLRGLERGLSRLSERGTAAPAASRRMASRCDMYISLVLVRRRSGRGLPSRMINSRGDGVVPNASVRGLGSRLIMSRGLPCEERGLLRSSATCGGSAT